MKSRFIATLAMAAAAGAIGLARSRPRRHRHGHRHRWRDDRPEAGQRTDNRDTGPDRIAGRPVSVPVLRLREGPGPVWHHSASRDNR